MYDLYFHVQKQEGSNLLEKYKNWLLKGGVLRVGAKFIWTGTMITALVTLNWLEMFFIGVFGWIALLIYMSIRPPNYAYAGQEEM